MKKSLYTITTFILIVASFAIPFDAYAFSADSAKMVRSSIQYFSAVNSASLAITNNMTIEGWFKFTSTPSNNNSFALVALNDENNQRAYDFRLANNAGTMQLVLNISSSGSNNSASVVGWSPSTATWYHLSASFASDQVVFTVNGVQQGTTQTNGNSSIHASTAVFGIGATDYPADGDTNTLDGQASNVRLWSQVQSVATILADQCSVINSATGLNGSWTLDNTLTDGSGNSNTLTNQNTATFIADVPSTCVTVAPFNFGTVTFFGWW